MIIHMFLKVLLCISMQDNQTIYIEDVGEARLVKEKILAVYVLPINKNLRLQKRKILRSVLIPAWPIVDHKE